QLGGRADFVIDQLNGPAAEVHTVDPIPLNTWVHLVGVYDTVAHELRIYVNGQLSNTTTGVNLGPIDPVSDLLIGKFKRFSLSRDEFFPGLIDEVGYFNRALSDSEVQAIATGPRTIRPSDALPTITDPVSIDGYTQPGASRNTDPNGFNGKLLIELSG